MENFSTDSNILAIQPRYDDLIVIIPAYNEELFIGSSILKLKKYTKTIILVDDASSDETTQLAKYLINTDYIIINDTNVGFFKTLKIGLNKAKNLPGKYILILPVLPFFNFELIDEVIDPLIKNNELDISLGIYQNVYDHYKNTFFETINTHKKTIKNLNNIAIFIFKKSALNDDINILDSYDDFLNSLLINKNFSLKKISLKRNIRKAPIIIIIILYIILAFIVSIMLVILLEMYFGSIVNVYSPIIFIIIGIITSILLYIKYRRYFNE